MVVQIMYDKEEYKLPWHLQDAALDIVAWFKERNIKNWQYGGIEVRDYDPEWYEVSPEARQKERDRKANEWRELRKLDIEKARRRWRDQQLTRRMLRNVEKTLLAHIHPMTVLSRFLHGKPLPPSKEKVTFRRAVPFE